VDFLSFHSCFVLIRKCQVSINVFTSPPHRSCPSMTRNLLYPHKFSLVRIWIPDLSPRRTAVSVYAAIYLSALIRPSLTFCYASQVLEQTLIISGHAFSFLGLRICLKAEQASYLSLRSVTLCPLWQQETYRRRTWGLLVSSVDEHIHTKADTGFFAGRYMSPAEHSQ
jgi:hypothetical protein